MLKYQREDVVNDLNENYITEMYMDMNTGAMMPDANDYANNYYYQILHTIEKAYKDSGLIPFRKLKHKKESKGIKSYYIKGDDTPLFTIEGYNLVKPGTMTNVTGVALKYKIYYWSSYYVYDAKLMLKHKDEKELKKLYKEAKRKIKEDRKRR